MPLSRKLNSFLKKGAKVFLVFSFLFYSIFPYPAVLFANASEEQPADLPSQATDESSQLQEAVSSESPTDTALEPVDNSSSSGLESGFPTGSEETNAPAGQSTQENQENPVITSSENVVDGASENEAPAATTNDSVVSQNSQTTPEQPAGSISKTIPGDPAATNFSTGADSSNSSETNVANTKNITNTNNAVAYNDAYLKSETGNNNASYNSGSGIITTEKADGRGELVNIINNNIVNINPAETGPINVGNENTGANSENKAVVNITNETVIKNINNSDTINRVKADVISGRNNTNFNTGHGIILSGQANLGLNFMTLANTNFTGVNNLYADMQNIFGNHMGNVDFNPAKLSTPQLKQALINAGNQNTGAGSVNSAIVNVNDQTTITNNNNGKIQNEITANIISGQNKSSNNTGTGSIATGNVQSSVNVMNFLNANITASNFWLKSFNVFGNWFGNINLPKMPNPNLSISPFNGDIAGSNSQTGAGSENSATIDVNNEFDETNINVAEISNNFYSKANTGNNQTSYNNGSGAIKYGSADAQTNTANVADINITGDAWWILIVNKFGNWSGTTIGSPSDMVVNSDSNAIVLSPQNSGINIKNDTTGPQSNNSAGVNINNGTDISNENNAKIINEVSVIAISGENEAQYNLGHGFIEAGDIKSVINAVNVANVNVNVGNMLIAVVNVFGNWSGNIVFNNGSLPQLSNFSSLTGSDAGSGSSATTTASNGSTGATSQNNSLTNSNTNVNVGNTNKSTDNNTSSTTSSSGLNGANYNTGSGIVTTGIADAASKIFNQSNNNKVNIGQIDCGNLASVNQSTGAGSKNNSVAESACNIGVSNNNDSENNNNVVINNSTGGNTASYNTGNGVVDTSWVNTFVQLYNESNDNQITVGQVEEIIDNGGNGDDQTGSGNGSGSSGDENNGGQDNGNDTDNGNDSSGGNTEGSGSSGQSGSGSGASGGDSGASGGSGVSGGVSGGGGGGGGDNEVIRRPISNNQISQTNSVGSGTDCSNNKKGDINCDGKVNIYDLSILMANWAKKFKDKRADLTKDGKVDFYDLSIIMANWTKSSSLASR